MAKKLFAKAFGKDKRTDAEKMADLKKAIAEAEALQKKPKMTDPELRKGLNSIKTRYKMVSLSLMVDKTDEAAGLETVYVEGEINPKYKSGKSTIEIEGGTIKEITIARPSFSSPTKKAVNPTNLDLVAKELDRCHVLSSSDMAVHIQDTLTGKTFAEAAACLKKKQAVSPPLKAVNVLAAAKALHKRFFNDTDNLFLGGASVNRSLGEKVDPRHPDMTNAKLLNAHIKKMIDLYKIGPNFKVSR